MCAENLAQIGDNGRLVGAELWALQNDGGINIAEIEASFVHQAHLHVSLHAVSLCSYQKQSNTVN